MISACVCGARLTGWQQQLGSGNPFSWSGNHWPLLTPNIEGRYALRRWHVYVCYTWCWPVYLSLMGVQRVVFWNTILTDTVIPIAILREQTEWALRGEGHKSRAGKETKKPFICRWLVSKFKGKRLVFMCKCVKCKGVRTHTLTHRDVYSMCTQTNIHTNKLWLSPVIT